MLYHLSYTHHVVRSFPTGREKVYRVREGARAPVSPDPVTGREYGRDQGTDYCPAGPLWRAAISLARAESGPGCGTKTASR